MFDEEDVLWMPIINRENMVIEPKSFPRILFYGQTERVFETEQECQNFCDNSEIKEEKPFEDCDDDIRILTIVEK